jgi:hypothetical protein
MKAIGSFWSETGGCARCGTNNQGERALKNSQLTSGEIPAILGARTLGA